MKMSKPDLENECSVRELPTSGTAKELRDRLLSGDLKELKETTESKILETMRVEDKEKMNDSQANGFSSAPKADGAASVQDVVDGKSSDLTMSMFFQFMMQQEKHRQEEENRRRDEENRRREEENRRWESIMQTQQQFFGEILNKNTCTDKADQHFMQRSVERWKGEVSTLIDEMHSGIRDAVTKEAILNIAERLKSCDKKLMKALDEKIDRLEKDEETVKLEQQIIKLSSDINNVHTEGMVYVNKAKEAELEKSRAGPLPAGTDIPKFDGNILNYRQWWDHFNSLVHENPSVRKFRKKKYLLSAM